MDQTPTLAQREVLTKILSGRAGGIWSQLSTSKNFLGIVSAKFDYMNDQHTWSVRAGSILAVEGGFIKAPEGTNVESKPNKAQTYDRFAGPSMEKTVGNTKRYRAQVLVLDYDISGRYSTAGRFKYEGP